MDFHPGRRSWGGMRLFLTAIGWMTLVAPTGGADDPGARAVHQQQIQRQQQQDALQLRMQQQLRAVQNPQQDAAQNQALERLQADQRQRQQELHYRQGIEPPVVQPPDDEGTRQAKAAVERQKAQQQGQELLRRSDAKPQKKQAGFTGSTQLNPSLE